VACQRRHFQSPLGLKLQWQKKANVLPVSFYQDLLLLGKMGGAFGEGFALRKPSVLSRYMVKAYQAET
jgi:hypothetical protein